MSYFLFTKPYRPPSDLLNYLQEKGLIIDDLASAERFLNSINYYRFKIYLVPFHDHAASKYEPTASFDDGLELYRFDDELRNILFSAIGRIEIKLRSRLDQVVTSHSNSHYGRY